MRLCRLLVCSLALYACCSGCGEPRLQQLDRDIEQEEEDKPPIFDESPPMEDDPRELPCDFGGLPGYRLVYDECGDAKPITLGAWGVPIGGNDCQLRELREWPETCELRVTVVCEKPEEFNTGTDFEGDWWEFDPDDLIDSSLQIAADECRVDYIMFG